MKTNKLNKLVISSFLIVPAAIISLPLVTSCSNNSSSKNKIISMHEEYLNKEKEFISNDESMLPKFENEESFEQTMKQIIDNSQEAVNKIKEYIEKNNLSQNERVWAESYIFQWENKIKNVQSGMIFLGANPITGGRVLGSSANHIASLVKDGINIYPLNPETGDPDSSKEADPKLVKNLNNKVKSTIAAIKTFKNILNYGATKYGFMPSSIAKKLLVNQLIDTFYQNQLELFSKGQENEITIKKLVNDKETNEKSNNYFAIILVEIQRYISDDKKLEEVRTNITELSNTLNDFVDWYSSDYYANENSFGSEIAPGEANILKISKSNNNNEIEKSIVLNFNSKKVYGLGLTEQDLNTTGIGIGFMKLKNLNQSKFLSVADGNAVYQQLLNNNNSINTSASDIYAKGIKLSKEAKVNMDAVAQQVKSIITGGFDQIIKYDDDGIGPNGIQDFQLSSLSSDFEKFNKWLNQEDFFFGRETFADNAAKDKFIDHYWTNVSSEWERYKNTISKQGYERAWFGKETINGEATGTVSGNQALAGAVLSYIGYEEFKNITDSIYDEMFNWIPDYILSPYDYSIRVDIGVGMEGPRGSNQFQYNCDPYYSLPKWSLSSLTTHEGKMGHHTQNAYWTRYLQGKDGKDGSGPGYTFVNDAFHEGWAVFTEWYANELGIYGSELNDSTRMPSNFLIANGVVPKYDSKKLDEQTKIMKELHGGVYYNKALGADGSDEKLQNSIKLANLLQYYGYLNEAQLRNMRLCLDVAYHFKGSSGADSSLQFGASIKTIRDFMTNNSALSIGDISSESIRYAVMPSQATGYMLGKEIFEELYKAVQTKLNVSLNDKNNSKESKALFDLMLRNGEIPLEVLRKTIREHYEIK